MEHKQRAKMPTSQRAKQFMPFAAVKGLEKAIAEQDQLLNCTEQAELGEEQVQAISDKLNHLTKGDMVSACFYVDGRYNTVQGKVEQLDLVRRIIRIAGAVITIESIRELECITIGRSNTNWFRQ